MDETQYYQTVYSRFWREQTRKYGYGVYEKNLTGLILRSSPRQVFEVGIGTGWPIGAALKKRGVRVDGCDIAESSVALAREELENTEGIWAGDVSGYEGRDAYDVTYCVRASWYMADFYRTVTKMISMTKPGGYIVFDVMDQNSFCCLKLRWRALKEQYYRLLGVDIDERYGTHFISLFKMKRFLKKSGLSFRCWGEREITHSTDKMNTPKVVFYCRKGQ